MKAVRRFLTRLFNSATQQSQEERLREEIEEHIALQTEENIRAGLSAVEARRQAMLKFGGVEAMKQDYRAQRGLLFIENLLGDLRNAGRTIRRMPGLSPSWAWANRATPITCPLRSRKVSERVPPCSRHGSAPARLRPRRAGRAG